MKCRTYARFVALALSLTLLTACGPRGERLSVQHGRLRLLQPGERLHPDQSQPDLSCPIPLSPTRPSRTPPCRTKDQEDSSKPRWRSQR